MVCLQIQKMNLPRYEFCKENKSLLLNFIKTANQCKSNPYCNYREHEQLSKILPLSNILAECSENNEIINISDSDEEVINDIDLSNLHQTLDESLKPLNQTVADDITYAIKEILETEKCLSSSVIADLHKPNLDLEDIFKQLVEELNSEGIIDFGRSLRLNVISDDNIIVAYVKHLLIKQLVLEYSDQFQNNLNEFCNKFPDILSEELSSYLLNFTNSYSRVTLQFIDGLSAEFKTRLLSNLVTNCKDLEENHISLFDVLLGDLIENNSLNKLVEILSKSADKYTTNKTYGKFLLKVIQLLGKHVSMLEKPMNHIIGTHRSIWKAKILKIFNELMQDSLLLSQSLIY